MKNSNKKIIKLITHNGSFHTDDVFACAALSLMFDKKNKKFKIIRTRDEKIIKVGDYVFDVGGVYNPSVNRFDHHQPSFKEKRKNGIVYSSFGLIWKKFGVEISGSQKIADILEKKLVSPVDAWDNGFDLVKNKYETSPYYIQHIFLAMRPTWREENLKDDTMFLKAVSIAKEVLSREVIQVRDALLAEREVISSYKKSRDKRIVVLDKNYPYEYTLNKFREPLFVICQRKTDKFWAAKAVKEDIKTFKNRKNFPRIWAGLREDKLPKVSGVSDAVFCHRGLFLAVAKSKAGAVKLAQIALKAKS